jgi:hypothetical protein
VFKENKGEIKKIMKTSFHSSSKKNNNNNNNFKNKFPVSGPDKVSSWANIW